MKAAGTENGRLAWRSSKNALWRRSANLVSRNGRAVAGGMARGDVNSGPRRPAGRTRRNAPPDSGWPEHPNTDYHLPQVRDDWACGRTACHRARLDPGVGPVRNRVEGSNPGPGERLGSISQATRAGHRRKGLGSGPAKLPALNFPVPIRRPSGLHPVCRQSVFLPHRLILRKGVIAFAGVDFVAVLLGNDLDFSEFSIPLLVLRVVPEAVLVMEFV
jgi:hypothetical protein